MVAPQDILAELESQRQALGMSLSVLARRCGLSIATVQRSLRDQRRGRLSTVLAMANVLGMDVGVVRRRRVSAIQQRQAKEKARKLVSMALGNAALENQTVDEEARRSIEREIEESLLRGSKLCLWA